MTAYALSEPGFKSHRFALKMQYKSVYVILKIKNINIRCALIKHRPQLVKTKPIIREYYQR